MQACFLCGSYSARHFPPLSALETLSHVSLPMLGKQQKKHPMTHRVFVCNTIATLGQNH